MSPSNNTTTTTATSTTTNDDVWDSQALGASDLQGLDGSFSNVMDEDFLLMDGLEIEDDSPRSSSRRLVLRSGSTG